MAKNITGQVLGGTTKPNLAGDTVKEVYEALGLSGNYTATVNGETANLNDEVEDYSFVSFAPSVKGGI